MNSFDKFFNVFSIPKVEYKEPGRTVDDNNEICEFYITEDYPSLYPVFCDLFEYYTLQLDGKIKITEEITLNDLFESLVIGLTNRYIETRDETIKEDVQEIFKEEYHECR